MELLNFEEGYSAAHESAVIVDRSAVGWLHISGESRIKLIQRMSTQNLLGMQVGEGRATVLTTEIGRIIERIILYSHEEGLDIATSDQNSEIIARYLLRNVFFNDDFQLGNLTAQTFTLGIYGKLATERLNELFRLPDAIPLHHWRPIATDNWEFLLFRTDPIAGDGYWLRGEKASLQPVIDWLTQLGLGQISHNCYNYLRVESGLPILRHELTLDYIPLETGLWSDISFSKGCYTGQEIIARMESRGKLAKRLVKLHATEAVQVGDSIWAGQQNVGTITSAESSSIGHVALGYVKTAALEESAELRVGALPLQWK